MSLSYPYTFTVNGTSFADCVFRYGYSTTYTPVYSASVTTMDTVEHTVIKRWRHGLSFRLNPVSESRLHELQTALMRSPVPQIVFSSLQLEADVTARMKLSPLSAELVLKNASRRVLGGITLDFTEL